MTRAPRVVASLACMSLLAIPLRPLYAAASRQIAMPEFVQEIWEARDRSLPHPMVSTLLHTRDGYLWIGTASGLARFDGQQFYVPHREREPALATHVRSLAESPDGSLWIGTRRSGLFRLKAGRFESLTKRVGVPEGYDVRTMAIDRGVLWIGAGANVFRWDLEKQEGRRLGASEGLSGALVLAMHVDGSGVLWVVTSGGVVARWDGARFVSTALPELVTVRDMQSAGIAHDPSGTLWIASESGLLKRTGSEDRAASFARIVSEPCRSVFAGPGGVWAGCNSGVVHLHEGRVRSYGPRDGIVQEWLDRIYQDPDGSVWIASRTGLLRLRPRVVQTYAERDGGRRFGATDCVLETRDGDLWVGSAAGLSRRHDGRWTTYDTRHGLPHAWVRALAEGPDGSLWVGTADGLVRWQNGRVTERHRPPVNRAIVRAIAVDAEGRPWFGTPDALVYRVENGSMVQAADRRRKCTRGLPGHLRFHSDGTLLVGNEEGFVRLRGGGWSCELDPATLRNDIRHILEGAGGRLWLGTIGGVSLFENGALRPIPGDAGPFDTAAYAIVDDAQGAFWFSTPKGLFRVLRSNLEQGAARGRMPVFRYFGAEDGMESAVCVGTGQPNGWRGRDGRLYFTTADGIAVVDPRRIQVSRNVPPVYIDGLKADQRVVELAERVVLPPGTRALQIDFTAVNFIAPDMIQYRYRLDGFDADWTPSGSRRTAYYTNLAPGPYRFRVSAANPDGVWNETGAVLQLELRPYFYQRRAFHVLAVVLLIGAVGLAFRLRIARLRANEIELKRRVDDAMAQAKVLRGLLPICASCKKIRDDTGYWNQMETYIQEHSGADFSHSVCPDCMTRLYPDYAAHRRGES